MAAKKPAAKKKEVAAVEQPAPPAPEPEPVGIDARMAALLKDHQRMGARPK